MKRYYCILCRKTHRLKKSKIGKKHWLLGFGEKVGIERRMDLEEWSKSPKRNREALRGMGMKKVKA